ncbi:hypothetical protein ACA910_017209 [Epithemia clementina (nom. ined.)]
MLLVRQQHTGDHETVGADGSAGIIKGDVPRVEMDSPESDEHQSKIEQYKSNNTSLWNNISLFRDFFLAAFSDGYQNGCFCGDGMPPCCDSSSRGKSVHDDSTLRSLRSTNSHDTSLKNSPSQEFRRRRKKPLAVAVGFKYAEDQNGRPIVVTPTGSRSAPIDLTGVRQSPPRSPPPLPRLRSGGSSVGLPPIQPHVDNSARTSPVLLDSKYGKW